MFMYTENAKIMWSLVSGNLEARLTAIERDIQTSERNRLSMIKQKVPNP